MSSIGKLLSPTDVGASRTHQAGILVPKDPRILAFFPHLNPAEFNPDVDISVYVPALEAHWTLRYVYYNGRMHSHGTRNEYRLTRMTALLRELGAEPGHTLTFTRSSIGDISVTVDTAWTESTGTEAKQTRTLGSGWSLTITEEG